MDGAEDVTFTVPDALETAMLAVVPAVKLSDAGETVKLAVLTALIVTGTLRLTVRPSDRIRTLTLVDPAFSALRVMTWLA